jgi:alpha-galactosidase
VELRTKTLELLADVETGVRRLSVPGVSFLNLVVLGAGCRFRFGANDYYLTRPTPDAIIQDDDRLVTTYHWRHKKFEGSLTLQVEYRFTSPEPDAALHIVARLKSDMPAPVYVDTIEPLLIKSEWNGAVQLGHRPAEWSILRNGWQSWSATRTFRFDERDPRPRFRFLTEMEENVANPSSGRRGCFNSEQVLALTNTSSGQQMVAGFLTARRSFGDFLVEIDRQGNRVTRLRAQSHFDGLRLDQGEACDSEPLWLRLGQRKDELLDTFMKTSGAAMNARVPAKAPVGWCSWYHYYTKVNQQDLVANLTQLASLRDHVEMEVFQLDDGYQSAIGDWLTTNKKFPDGLASLAGQIAEAGFTPGIWTAPFIVDPNSALAKAHPDWLLRHENGKPIRGVYNPLWNPWRGFWALDPTIPAVQDWLVETFTALREMGWHFFKIDFLYAAALPAVRFDAKASRAAALRAGLEAIRRGVGEDATILGCGCPLGPAVGIADLMRIGPDVTPRWKNPMRPVLRDRHCLSTVHAARNTIHRQFTHRRWWVNDPDCVLAREKRNKLTLPEIRTFASLAAVSGGMFLLSDDMTQYPLARLDLVKTALSCRTETMRVLDAQVGEYPTRMLARTEDGYLLLVVNFSDEEANPVLDLQEILALDELARLREVREVWLDRPISQQDGLMHLGRVSPHGCRLLRLQLVAPGETHG